MRPLNGYRVVLLTSIVALVGFGIAGTILADSYQGVIVALVSPTVVALVALLRAEGTRHEITEHREATEPPEEPQRDSPSEPTERLP